jgi:hypothetical protein
MHSVARGRGRASRPPCRAESISAESLTGSDHTSRNDRMQCRSAVYWQSLRNHHGQRGEAASAQPYGSHSSPADFVVVARHRHWATANDLILKVLEEAIRCDTKLYPIPPLREIGYVVLAHYLRQILTVVRIKQTPVSDRVEWHYPYWV